MNRGLEPTLKSVRLANYIISLRKEILALCRACGVDHPSRVPASRIEVLDDRFGAKTVAELFGGRGRGAGCDDEREATIEGPVSPLSAPLVFRKGVISPGRWPRPTPRAETKNAGPGYPEPCMRVG